jgi:mitochondrial enoyl-[acyl-carrier protein] reductase / trans-2-enoyl-CoA reductase
MEVLRLAHRDAPEPGPGELRVRMQRAPINPADLNFIEGTYGIKPTLPAVPGMEGCGIVDAVGPRVEGFQPGDLVLVPGIGTWQRHHTLNASRCFRLPAELSPDLACMLYINPPTAWGLLHEFTPLAPGSWIIQNGANSAVGRCVIQLARARGWKTLNLVRRADVIDELRALGGDVVELDEPTLPKRLDALIGGAVIPLGLNCVSGESASTVAKCLGQNGHLVTYGAMSRQPLKIPNGLLIFKNLHLHGFWLTRFYQSAPRPLAQAIITELAALMMQGAMTIAVDAVYPLSQHAAALRRAHEDGRSGKVLLALDQD